MLKLHEKIANEVMSCLHENDQMYALFVLMNEYAYDALREKLQTRIEKILEIDRQGR